MTKLTIVEAGDGHRSTILAGPALVHAHAVFDDIACQLVVYCDEDGAPSVADRADGNPAEFDQCAAPFGQMLADHVRSQPDDLERALPFLRQFMSPVELLRLVASTRAAAA